MMALNKKSIFLIIVFSYGSNCYSPRENVTLTSTIISDINRAFCNVIKSSYSIDRLIPNILNFSNIDPVYIFEIPQNHKIQRILRSDFEEPNFPNLALPYIKLMQNRKTLMNSSKHFYDLELQKDNKRIEILKKRNATSTERNKQFDNWQTLGLPGWEGEIFELNSHKMHVSNNLNPAVEMLKDTSLKKILQSLNVFNHSSSHSAPTATQTEVIVYFDSDIYIARVNDPFGKSTIWQLRNPVNRVKRAVGELYSMIKCATGCDPLIYRGYGCYCGFLGAGVPVNGIDRCCRLHDHCYEYSNCLSYLEYFAPYIWKCFRGTPLCAVNHGEWGGSNSCASKLCKCDLYLSQCLRRFTCPKMRAVCTTSTARILQNLLFIK